MPLSNRHKPPEPWFAAIHTPHFPAQTLSAGNLFLRGKAFAVIEQSDGNHKTPVLAVSETARDLGIAAGFSAWMVSRKWPRVALLPRDMKAEARLRASIEAALLSFTPVLSVRDNGSALLDMTGSPSCRKTDPATWGRQVYAAVRRLGLESVSLGAAPSQVVARVLARMNQPDGMQICLPGGEEIYLDRLPPEILPGLSPHSREGLRKYGIATIASLRLLGKEELSLRFGQEAEKLYCLSRGMDLEAASPGRKPLYAETVLSQDLNDAEALRNQVRLTADKLAHLLRLNDSRAAQVSMELTYSDRKSVRRTVKFNPPTAAFLVIAEKTEILFTELYQRRVALRRIRLVVSLPQMETGQIDLFDGVWTRKQDALALAIDRIRRKRSFNDVLSASNLL